MTLRRLGAALVLAMAASTCGRAGTGGLTLLFLGRSPAATAGGLSWAPDPENSRLVGLDGRLRPVRTVAGPWLAQPVAVSTSGGRLLVTELNGDGLLIDPQGRLVREWPSVFAVAAYAGAAGAPGGAIAAVRSPYRVPLLLPEPAGTPLVQLLDTLGRPTDGLAAIRVPEPPFLTQIVNAGSIALGPDGAVYFAPLARDEIRKYDATGTLLWTATRGLGFVVEPQYVARPGGGLPDVKHVAANVALVLGPDGRLYALGVADTTGARLRLDVLDTRTGTILLTRPLDSGSVAVALAPDGTVRTVAAAPLLAGAPAGGREPFAPPFALPNVSGDTVRLADYAGKVTLVNFWASWCDPCREEFPHMAALYRDLRGRDFAIAAISDDVDRRAMTEFLDRFQPPFPILVGGGRMKGTYHYRGLPYSLLLDRRGRVIERIFGFGGAREFARLRETIAKEVASP
ncbi:MAG TPA: redoxin domain-containing protein [Gemmatimonadales bacterium]